MAPPQMRKPQGQNNRKKPSSQQSDAQSADGGMSSQQQQNKVINRKISHAAETGDMEKLSEVILANLPQMNGINIATALHRIAKLASSGWHDLASFKRHKVIHELLDAVSNHVLQGKSQESGRMPGEMPVQCLSIIAWSCATLRIHRSALFAAIAEITAPRLSELKPYEITNLLWAFAKLGMSPCAFLKAVSVTLLQRKEGAFNVQCLSTVAWSFATTKRRNVALFSSLAREFMAHAAEMKPQELSNTLWAFAKNRHANAELFEALGNVAASNTTMAAFKPQEVSSTAWAFATVGRQHPALFAKISSICIKRSREMAPQNVANILWAFAKLGIQSSQGLFNSFLGVVVHKLSQHKPQELSAIIWAASQACPASHAGFFTVITQCCVNRSQEFSGNGLANLVKALAGVTMDDPSLFLALLQKGLAQISRFRPQALVSFLHGAIHAVRNPCYAASQEQIVEVAVHTAEYMTTRGQEFPLNELQDLLSALQLWPACPSTQAIVQAMRHLLEVPARSPHGAITIDSMSTSADSQEEDEDESCWPTDRVDPSKTCSYDSPASGQQTLGDLAAARVPKQSEGRFGASRPGAHNSKVNALAEVPNFNINPCNGFVGEAFANTNPSVFTRQPMDQDPWWVPVQNPHRRGAPEASLGALDPMFVPISLSLEKASEDSADLPIHLLPPTGGESEEERARHLALHWSCLMGAHQVLTA